MTTHALRRAARTSARPRRALMVARRLTAALCVVGMMVLAAASSASANVATLQTISAAQAVDPTTGHVTVTLSGTWTWPFSSLHATSSHNCDDRVGVGWTVAWNDPDDPGYPMGKPRRGISLDSGSNGSDGLNAAEQVVYDQADPCGTFVQTNSPRTGDGNVQGNWSDTHVYASEASVPATACVIFFDLGFPPGPASRRLLVTNTDNTFLDSLEHGGTWTSDSSNANCVALNGQAVTTSQTVTATTDTAAAPTPVPVTSSSLAYTGAGGGLALLALLGASSTLAAVALLIGRRLRRQPC